MKQSDAEYLKQCLKLAKKGRGHTFPNPMVGAAIVKNGEIIGSGYHHQAGLAHAEIEALRTLKGSAKGATLYVSLEPCSHQGKTPPCVEAIIDSGVSRVVCCSLDPNPLVSGKGVARLREAGIEVVVGNHQSEAERLNEAFFSFHKQQRPFIAIKFAASLDGKIATESGDSKWITNDKARNLARQLRGQYQAILAGANTVIHDDPHLGVRTRGSYQPLRIILDSSLRVPLTSQVFRDTNVLVVTTQRASQAKRAAFAKKGIELFVCAEDSIRLPELIKELARRQIISIFVEGGGSVLGSFVDAGLVDKVYTFYGPMLIGGSGAIGAIGGQGAKTINQALKLNQITYKKIDDSTMISGYVSP